MNRRSYIIFVSDVYLKVLIISLSKLKSSSATCKYKFFGCSPISIKVALGIVLWSLKAICLVDTQAKHCILLCVSMTKSLHISHILNLSALLQDIPSIALCMSGTLSSSSEVSICGQTESAETRHSQNESKVCIMQTCNRHPCLTYPQSPS